MPMRRTISVPLHLLTQVQGIFFHIFYLFVRENGLNTVDITYLLCYYVFV